jgi:hypothetical protein
MNRKPFAGYFFYGASSQWDRANYAASWGLWNSPSGINGWVCISGSWKKIKSAVICISGAWKDLKRWVINISGAWKEI